MNSVEIVAQVIEALNAAGTPYMLVGSFSSNLYGVPRSTKDADFVLQTGASPVSALVAAMGAEFHLDPQLTFETVTATTRHLIRHSASHFKIEFFELSQDAYDLERFGRRRQATFEGRPVFVASAEDVVITKLRWSRSGQRAKDVEDVKNVLAVQGQALDLAYMRAWCDRQGTRELFERLLAEASQE